jgi:hypothetical protein
MADPSREEGGGGGGEGGLGVEGGGAMASWRRSIAGEPGRARHGEGGHQSLPRPVLGKSQHIHAELGGDLDALGHGKRAEGAP